MSSISSIFISKEVKEELELFKAGYSLFLADQEDNSGNPIPVRVSWTQLFRRWMEMTEQYVPEIADYVTEIKQRRQANPPAPTYPVDPIEGAGSLKHVFERDGEEIEARAGEDTPFYAVICGRRFDFKEMLADDWVLMNEIGVEIDDIEVAWEISRKIKGR